VKRNKQGKIDRSGQGPPRSEGVPPAGAAAAVDPNARRRLVVIVVVVLLIVGVCAVLFFATMARGANPVLVMETSMGTVKIELYERDAPITVKNFLAYVNEKHYDGTIFHRVIPDFMTQGGGFLPGMKERRPSRNPIRNESYNGLRNERGTLAMARTNDPDSASDQFFINVKHNDFLDREKAKDRVGYAVFGRVLEGMEVVDRIRAVPTRTQGPHENVPIEDVLILSIRRVD